MILGVTGVLTVVGALAGTLIWPEVVVLAGCMGLLAALVAS